MIDQAEKLRQVISSLRMRQTQNGAETAAAGIRKTARVITVTSGKGGVGKTNVSINLAIALAELGLRVVIFDADFGLANIDVLFGIVPQYTLLDVIHNQKSILEVLSEGPFNIRFISGGSGVEELVKLENWQLKRVLDNLILLDKIADVILVDTGAGLSDNVMSFVLAADEVVLVTTPEPTSITDSYALIKMVSNRDRNKVIRVLINRAENQNEAFDILGKLSMVTQRFLKFELHPLGYILNDDSVIKAVKQQKPFSLCYPRSHASKMIREIAAKLAQGYVEEDAHTGEKGMRRFLGRLVSLIKT